MSACGIDLVSERRITVSEGTINGHPRFIYGIRHIVPETLEEQLNDHNEAYINSVIDYFKRMEGRSRQHRQWISFYVETKGCKIVHSVRLSSDFLREMCGIFNKSKDKERPWSVRLVLNGTFSIRTLKDWPLPLLVPAKMRVEKAFSLVDTLKAFEKSGNEALNLIIDDSIMCEVPQQKPLSFDLKTDIVTIHKLSIEWVEDMGEIWFDANNHASVTGCLFEHETSKDFTLACANGVEIRCHMNVLMSQSDVMTKMLSPDKEGMIERQSGRLELEEMSEQGLKQFVRLLYGQKVVNSKMTCEVVLEIFKYCHLYGMKNLLETLTDLLLHRKQSWYTADVLVEFYILLTRAEFRVNLRKFLLGCMGMTKDEIRNCEKYKELNPADREDLLWSLLCHTK